MTLSEELQWRGFANQTTLKDNTLLNSQKFTFYFGVDPSAPSMTIGNLAAAMMVRHFIRAGHKAILLVGGATGMIGDPDGKAQERDLKTDDEINANKKAIASQYTHIFGDLKFEIVDNYDWFKGVGYLQFLREVGKHVPMRQMLGRDFVQARLSEQGGGISYAEFSYVLIQAYDFLHLHREKGVNLQLAASDQWGNSIAGVDLIRRLTGDETHVWTTPLVVNKATGVKFGKSEDGAVWLDAKLTSAYKFYQFWLNMDDEGVEDYLKIYTELDKQAIDALMSTFNKDKASREAQKKLAFEVTKLVHGEDVAKTQAKIAETVFSNNNALELGDREFAVLVDEFGCVPVSVSDNSALKQDDVVNVVVEAGLASSKREARHFFESGAIRINGVKVSSEKQFLIPENKSAKYMLITRGKNQLAVLKIK